MEGYFYCLCEKGRLLLIRKAKGSEKRRGQGFKDSRGQKRKGSRIQGFKGSSGSLGIFFQNQKRQGVKGSSGERQKVRGLAENRRQKAEYRSQKSGGRRRLEGWKFS